MTRMVDCHACNYVTLYKTLSCKEIHSRDTPHWFDKVSCHHGKNPCDKELQVAFKSLGQPPANGQQDARALNPVTGC